MKKKMKKTVFYLSLFCLASLFAASCSPDNYEAPDAGIAGTVIDAVTGKGLITEQPNGFTIRYRQIDPQYPNAQWRNFWGKPDGTFQHTKLFATTHEVYPSDGAFVSLDESSRQKVTLSSGELKTLTFTVTPYVSISDFDVQKINGDSVSVKFKLKRNAGTIGDYRIFATNRTPLVGTNATDNVGGGAVTLQESQLASDGTLSIETGRKGFTPASGSTYWIRVGVRCTQSPASRYNLSEIKEIKF